VTFWLGVLLGLVIGFVVGAALIVLILFLVEHGFRGGQVGRSRIDFVILLFLLVIVAAFVAWEEAGLTPQFTTLHTISFLASHNRALAIAIGVLFVAGGAGGLLWWRHHLKTSIPK
jgi:hypothetical protein